MSKIRLGFYSLLTAVFLLTALFSCAGSKKETAVSAPAKDTATAKTEIQKLPVDPNVKIGKLENGLTYYIRKNAKPENRAELRLAVNAGSILEDDDQQGLAHFNEHMAFNGTKSFKKQELLDYLESFGMRLGPDLNAYTSFDETVYMLQVPTDSIALFQKAFQVLKEMAVDLALEDEEIDKERGVIVEEWRLGRGGDARIRDKQFPMIFHGSQYAERLPIGKKEIIENFDYDVLRRFYKDWYRPDLMAVIAVGDFEPADVEKLIQEQFNLIPKTRSPRERVKYTIPDHDETLFAIAGDPEASYSSIGVLFKLDKETEHSLKTYRQSWVENLFNSMFNQRLKELTQDANPPFIFATSSKGGFVRTKDVYDLSSMVSPGGFEKALTVLLREAKRVKQFGFTQSELDRQKGEMLRMMEQSYKERDKTKSRIFASEYIRNFLSNEPIPGIEAEFEIVQKIMPTISLAEINKLAGEWITDKNRVILASGPTGEGQTLPTKEELMAVFQASENDTVTPYVDKVSDAPLLEKIPEPGQILNEASNEKLGTTTLTLSNGVKVVLKKTDFKNDQILMSASSPGGTSLASDEFHTPASFATTFITQSGLGEFGPIELKKKLSGKVVRVQPSIGSLSEGFRGSAAPQDFETMLQLIHLYFNSARVDSVAYLSYRQRLKDYWKSTQSNPETAFRDTMQVVMAQKHYRKRVLSEQIFKEIDLQKSFEFFKSRFADASDFTFYFVGNLDIEKTKELSQTYLATLPGMQRKESWRDEGVRLPKGVVKKTLYRGLEPKSQVRIIFNGDSEWNLYNRRLISALADVLSLKLRETLREDLGGTYGVSARGSVKHYPYEGHRITISFGCNPDRVPEMLDAVFTQIDSIKQFGATDKILTKVREKSKLQYEKSLKENKTWLSLLNFHNWNGTNANTIIDGPAPFMKGLTSDKIKDAANKLINEENYLQFILMPESAKN